MIENIVDNARAAAKDLWIGLRNIGTGIGICLAVILFYGFILIVIPYVIFKVLGFGGLVVSAAILLFGGPLYNLGKKFWDEK